jgi:hypothetical protein
MPIVCSQRYRYALIHPSAWNGDSRKFALKEFSEVLHGLGPYNALGRAGAPTLARSSLCPSPTELWLFRYHAWRGNPSEEEVRDGPHGDNRCGSNRGGVACTAAPLRPRSEPEHSGFGLYNAPSRAGSPHRTWRGLRIAHLKRCAGSSVVRPYLPPVGRAHHGKHANNPPVLGAPASIMGSELLQDPL